MSLAIGRRGFLGSMIGLACSQVFTARLFHEPQQVLPKSHPKYRMLFRDTLSGFTIQAPGIADMDSAPGCWTFYTHSLLAMQAMRVDQVILLTAGGKVIQRSPFSHPICLVSEDTLKVTQRIFCDLPIIDFDEVIRLKELK